MSKIKTAIVYMGLGALATTVVMKMMSGCSVNDLMNKEKKMMKNIKNNFMN